MKFLMMAKGKEEIDNDTRINIRCTGWFADAHLSGRVVLMRKASDAIPKDMPRQLWYNTGSGDVAYNILSWKQNSGAGPKESDFERPEELRGWQVME